MDTLSRPSEYATLMAQLTDNPHDPDGWQRLVYVVEETGDHKKIRAAYDALLKQYPNNVAAQIQYINYHVNRNMCETVEVLFKEFLFRSPYVELWRLYLSYIRRMNPNPGRAQCDTIRKSYEFTLKHVGQEKDSGDIWIAYIGILQAEEATTIRDQHHKMDTLRKVYHQAVQIPLDNVASLWRELQTFETKQKMDDLSPAHMQAWRIYDQLVKHLKPLCSNKRPDFSLPSLPKFTISERVQVGKWKAYLKWEESNPLKAAKEIADLRIQNAYRKAMVHMQYHTEIWFMAYTWTNSVQRHEEALRLLRAGLDANPSSFLLNFAYVESLEINRNFGDVHKVYEKFIKILCAKLDKLSQSSGHLALASNSEADSHMDLSNIQSASSLLDHVDLMEWQEHQREYGLAWIMYMQFGMRAEGVKSCRTIFRKARKDQWVPWGVYEAAALTEYHCSNDKAIPSRIFEKGMETFGKDIQFVLCYLGFLISINDKNNAHALFERVIPTFPPEHARLLWECWARYVYRYGDLKDTLKLEQRMAEVYPEDPPIKRLALRHIHLGKDAIADRDLGFAIAKEQFLGSTPVSQPLLSHPQQQALSTSTSSLNNTVSGTKRPLSPGGEDGYRGKRVPIRERERSLSREVVRKESRVELRISRDRK